MLSRLFCWFWGHAWRVIQESGGPQPLSHVPLLCDRCGRSTICLPGLMDGREPEPVKATPVYDPIPARLNELVLQIREVSLATQRALGNIETRIASIEVLVTGLEGQVWKNSEEAKQLVASLSQDHRSRLDNLAADMSNMRSVLGDLTSLYKPRKMPKAGTINYTSDPRRGY